MKRKLLHNLAGIFFLILLGVCSFEWNCSEVLATDVNFSTKYVDEEGKYISIEIAVTDKEDLVSIDGEDWVFAGWYKTKECTYENAYKKTPEDIAYAKYVPANVLSVKCQVSKNAETKKENGEKVNMRMVSTVESLNYSDIGFEVSFNGGNFIKCSGNKKVYKRVDSCTEANVDYSFSPKLFDTKSEYFITHTLTGIGPNSQDGTFLIRPYWKTLDGTTVYGQNRTIKVSDTYSNIVSLSVKTSDYVEGLNVESSDTSVTVGTVEEHYLASENYATLRVQISSGTSAMKSVTQLTVMNGENPVAIEVHRNAYTEYTGESTTVDTSWYNVYGADAEEYVIATTADLYGFADIVNRTTDADTFSGQTVYLISDIEVNNMTVAEMQAALSDSTIEDPIKWVAIGYNAAGTKDADVSNYFSGTFDGQGHIIKGIYTEQYGMFGWAYSATIRNFSLQKSYIKSSTSSGSIVSTFDGAMESVYSNATIVDTSGTAGGLIARITNGTKLGTDIKSSQFSVKNCWYAGEITQNYTGTSSASCGGLVGFVVQGTAEKSHVIEHSLYTGKMNCTYTTTKSGKYLRAGGLVGALNSATMPLELSDCLSAGETLEKNATRSYEGSVVGYHGTTVVPDGEYVYTTEAWNECTVNQGTHAGVIIPSGTVTTYASYTNMQNLDYYKSTNTDGYWIVRENAVPALKSFADEWIDVAWYYDNKKDGADTFTISTKEQLYGLSAISQDNVFSKETFKLGKDIKVNTKTLNKELYTAEEWNATVAELREWKPIGNGAHRFNGIFNGQGHTISGLYMEATGNRAGLFAATDVSSEVRDLKLKNSYFTSTAGWIGSVAGEGAGIFDTIYSNAIVEGAGQQIGGIIGRVNKVSGSEHTINNCWFDGSVTLTYDTNAEIYGGAIAGAFVQGTLDITNCLNTGSVTHISATDATAKTNYYVGGMCGAVMNPAQLGISNCLNAGEIKSILTDGAKDEQKLVSAAVGYVRYGTDEKNPAENVTARTTLNRFFYITEYCENLIRTRDASFVVHNGTKDFTTEENLTGKISYINAVDKKNNRLNFCTSSNPEGAWVVTENDIPTLKSFTDEWIDVAWYYDTKDYDGGSNSFDISTAEEFYGFSAISQEYSFENDTVKLCKDVVLDKVAGREWTPIGTKEFRFKGIFDGGNRTISGVHVKANNSSQYFGMFGYTRNNIIKNFTLKNSSYTGNAMGMGCVVGSGEGDLSGIYCDDSVCISNSTARFIGGIIGHIQDDTRTGAANRLADTNCTVKNCWFNGSITQTVTGSASSDVAGIIGFAANGSIIIDNCLYNGNINISYTGASESKDSYASGLCGHHSAGSNSNLTISNSLSAGTINGSSYTKGYIGAVLGNYGGKETYKNVYATTECCENAVGKITTAQPVTPVNEDTLYNTIVDLDKNYWMAQETDVPVLKSLNDSSEILENITWLYESIGNETDPYMLSDASELKGFATLVNSGTLFVDEFVQLSNDIVVYEGDANQWAQEKNLPNESWTPIGTVDGDTIINAFQGTFDGDGHAIRGLYTTDTAGTYLGLFRKIKDATVCNLRIENSYFNTNKATFIGSVAGGGDGTFDSVYSNAIVHGSRFAGGLIGRVSENKTNNDTKMILKNCHFDGVVDLDYTGTSALYSGGLVGYVVHGSTLIDTCLYTGRISLDYNCNVANKTSWGAYVGALCGGDNGNGTSIGYVQVQNCISAGSVSSIVLSTSTSPEVAVIYTNQTIGYARHANSWAKNTYVFMNNTRTIESTGVTTESDETFARGSGSLAANFDVDSSFEKETLYGYGAQMWTDLTFTSNDRIAADNEALEEGAEAITEAGPIWAAIAGELPVPATLADNALEMTVGKPDTDLKGDGLSLETAYQITTVEELAGFALNSKSDNYAGKYVVLANDIIINEGEDASKWVDDKAEPTLPWNIEIGSEKYIDGLYFEGIFDGQNHTISGICFENGSPDAGVKEDREFVGLFATTEVGSEVRNLRLRNSYFEQVGTGWVGSVIGKCRGTVSNVYSDAIVKSSAENVGGIVAMADGYNYKNHSEGSESRISRNIDNCWYAGKIILVDEGRYSGGIIGLVNQGEWTLNNCVFTGKITCEYTGTSYAYVGGIAGALEVQKSTTTSEQETKLTLNSCISAGTIKTANADYGAGAFVGRAKANVWFTDDAKTEHKESKATHVVMNKVFATRDSGYQEVGHYGVDKDSDSAGNEYTATPTISGAAVWTNNADRLVGYCTEEVVGNYAGGSLEFNTFVIREEGVPVPNNFTDLNIVTPITNVDTILALTTMDASWTTKNAVNNGLGHYVLRTEGKTIDDYNNYLAALVEQGFESYTTLDETGTDGVYNVIYTKKAGEWVLNVLFVENTGKVTLTISNGLDNLSPDLEPEESTTSGTVTLSMLQVEGSKTAFNSLQHTLGYEDYYYGNSFVFKLPNGHFVINDGGNEADMPGLMKYLRKEAGLAEGDTTSKIHIDAWTVTHQHGDHFKVMRNIVDNPQYAQQLVVNAIYLNEPNQKAMLCEEEKDVMDTVAIQYRGIRMLRDANGNVPKVYWCQTGQTYYFDGLTMNILQSQEQIPVESYGKRNAGSSNGTDFNTASTNMLFTTANGKKVLITGDSNYVNMKWMMESYGSSSEMFAGINVYQVVHHGKNTSYDISGSDKNKINVFTDYVAGDGKIDVSLFPCSVFYEYNATHERPTGVFPGAEAANKYLIDTVSASEFIYGAGTVKVTLSDEITVGLDTSVDTGTDTPEIEEGETDE